MFISLASKKPRHSAAEKSFLSSKTKYKSGSISFSKWDLLFDTVENAEEYCEENFGVEIDDWIFIEEPKKESIGKNDDANANASVEDNSNNDTPPPTDDRSNEENSDEGDENSITKSPTSEPEKEYEECLKEACM